MALGCSLGVSFAPLLPTASADDAPAESHLLTTAQLKWAASQHKVDANQIKLLQADIDALAVSQKKEAAFESTLTAETRKLNVNQEKLQVLQGKVDVNQQKLAADQLKFGLAGQ